MPGSTVRNSLRKLRKALGIIRRSTYRRAAFHGVAAATEHRALISSLAPVTVVDVGANRGQFALVCRELSPEAQIHSFEPLGSAFEVLKRVFAGDAYTTLHASAIGVDDGVATMHVSGREDSSSLLPIGEAQSRHFAGTEESHTAEVRVAPLQVFLSARQLRAPALLKIDVQGYELTVLQGCESLLECFRHVYVECSFIELYRGQALASSVVAYLAMRGFLLVGVYNVSYDSQGLAIQADFLFERH